RSIGTSLIGRCRPEQRPEHFLQSCDQVVRLARSLGQLPYLLILHRHLLTQERVFTFKSRDILRLIGSDCRRLSRLVVPGRRLSLSSWPIHLSPMLSRPVATGRERSRQVAPPLCTRCAEQPTVE